MKLSQRARSFLLLFGASLFSLLPFLPFFLNSSRVILYRDLSDGTLPNKLFWLRGILEEGRIPRWMHFQSGGAPFYADIVSAPLYPLNIVFLLFGVEKAPQALTVYIMLHYPLLLLGLYFLFRTLGQQLRVALPLALAGAWCGYALSAHTMNHILSGVLALPWFALFWLRALKSGKTLDFIAASFFLALPIYGGDPQFTYMMALGASIYALAKHKLHAIRSIFTLGVLSLLCSAAQLLPTLELLRSSQRADSAFLSWGDICSIMPTRLADFIFPNFFGTASREMDFWGQKFTGDTKFAFYIHSLYIGFVPIYLGIWSICSGWASRRLKRQPKRIFLFLALMLPLLLSMGSWAPINLYDFAGRFMPLWSSFRYPERLAIYFLFIFYLLILPVFRAHYLSLRLARTKQWLQSLTFTTAICLGISLFFYWQFKEQPNKGSPQIHFFLMSVATFVIFLFAKYLRTRIITFFWLALVIADFAPMFPKNIWFQPDSISSADTYPAVGKIIADLKKNERQIRSGMPYRMLSLAPYSIPWEEKLGPDSPLDPIGYSVLAHWEGLSGNIPSVFGISSVQGFFALELTGMSRLVYTLRKTHYGFLQNIFGVRYVLSRSANKPPEVHLNPDALPYFYFPDSIFAVRTMAETIDRFMKAEKGAEQTVFIQSPWNLRQGDRKPLVELVKRDSVSASFRVIAPDMPDPVHFVWNESLYPAWRAFLNEKELPILRVNGWAMGVAFPPLAHGEYQLEFRFDETPIRLGKALTTLWILIFCFFLYRSRNYFCCSKRIS
jgi:hypothetical protein